MSLELRKLSFDEHPWPDVPHLVLAPTQDSERGCLDALLEASEDLANLFESHADIDEDEPWFGWAFQRADRLQSEHDLFESAAKDGELRPLIETYVARVIAFFKSTDAEPGFYVHEEKEAGSDAIRFLVSADAATYFDRYLEFLTVIDLEHTVAQHENVRILAEVLDDAQKARLRATLADQSGGEYFPDF